MSSMNTTTLYKKIVALYLVTGMVKPNELGGQFEHWDRNKDEVIDILEVFYIVLEISN